MSRLLYLLICFGFGAVIAVGAEIRVDAKIPAGNIVIEKIEGDRVTLHQEERDTPRFWFHWCFRVTGAAARTVTFEFTKGHVFGTRGPACSTDGGETWTWLGREVVRDNAFSYPFKEDENDVRFAFAIPYTERDLQKFLARHSRIPHLEVEELARTAHGRKIEILRAGRIDGAAKTRVLLVCRHHACESIANFVLEGVLESALAEDETGKSLRELVEIVAVPFMDKDGVEEGDQGKLRMPHDHWLDYARESLYPSVGALREKFDAEKKREVTVALDLHCPYISDTKVFLALGADPKIAAEAERFSRIFEQSIQGPLKYRQTDNLPFNKGWNTPATYEGVRSFWQWGETLPGIRMTGTLEVPYASVGEETVTPEKARVLGRDLVAALVRYLRGS